MNKIRVLVACEESQAVTKAFREIGHEAFSCDLQECSGGHPEWHFCEDVFEVIKREPKFDLMIAHPPCTYLSVSGAGWLYNKDGTRNETRYKNQMDALEFVHALMDVDIDRIAIENPISVISSYIREPDQIIQPWMFGDKAQKSTCLWLKNLPKLIPSNIVDKGEFFEWTDSKTGKQKKQPMWYYLAFCEAKTPEERRRARSKTFPGIAKEMANQWGDVGNLGIQMKMF
jgi:site-specific DNA-cytosine methylase